MLKHLLLVDDSKTIQKVIKIAFSSTNFTVSSASSLVEALEVCRTKKPGIIIADAHLEDASGPLDYSKLVHESGGVPIILLYGSHETINREAFETAGFQNFMKKPFEAKQIVSAVYSFYGENSPGLGDSGQKLPAPPSTSSTGTSDHFSTLPSAPNTSGSGLKSSTVPPVSLHGQLDEASRGKPAFEEFDPPPAFRPSQIPIPINQADEQSSSFQDNADIPTRPLLVPPMQSISNTIVPKVPNVPIEQKIDQIDEEKSEITGISEKTLRALIRSEIEIAFKDQIATIAKSVITAELRRLADEKTRHLSED